MTFLKLNYKFNEKGIRAILTLAEIFNMKGSVIISLLLYDGTYGVCDPRLYSLSLVH
jgi:hypothetical protein